MSYTPTTWTTGDTITATKLNKMEQGIASAGGGGCAIVELSATGYATTTQVYGSIVYATYDSVNSRWIVADDTVADWMGIYGFSNSAPRIIPPYLTVLPNSEDVALFFVEGNGATVSVTGNITATNLYYSWGSPIDNAYRITGDGSISLDN